MEGLLSSQSQAALSCDDESKGQFCESQGGSPRASMRSPKRCAQSDASERSVASTLLWDTPVRSRAHESRPASRIF
eukprot:6183830-Pleurochrysis_carterae.AAC.1